MAKAYRSSGKVSSYIWHQKGLNLSQNSCLKMRVNLGYSVLMGEYMLQGLLYVTLEKQKIVNEMLIASNFILNTVDTFLLESFCISLVQ